LIVMAFGRIWCLRRGDGRLLALPVAIVGSRPLALCITPRGIYYGEYRNNAERGAIKVMFSEDGLQWHSVHALHDVRHIHGIYHDPYTQSIWMTTGDYDQESGIWCTQDGFQTLECILRGSQQARAISLLFAERHVFFGSDTPLEQNRLYRLDRSNGKVRPLADVAGSVFHAARVGEQLLFSTAVEPSETNATREAMLYASRDGETWHVLARHSKDYWHMSYFQYGQLLLPGGDNRTGRVFYSTFAVNPDHFIYSESLHVE
jgi:hypothetical protein